LNLPFVDFSEFSYDNVIADQKVIFEHNPHRFEMALLDGILLIDDLRAVGYMDVARDAFWVRGHFPQHPVMPGVLICESAAQLTCFFSSYNKIRGDGVMGLGGLEGCRFRSQVVPGDRLTTMLRIKKFRQNMLIVTEFQAFVGQRLCAEGEIKGAMLPNIE
jgi:3-hydroxyacyl-[acyl-carrier-protein] dehydratase